MTPTLERQPVPCARLRFLVHAAAGLSIVALLGCNTPPRPAGEADAGDPAAANACRSVHLRIDGLLIRAEECRYATGHWRVLVEPALPGLALWRDRERVDTVLQLFSKSPSDSLASILPVLRDRGHIPDDDDCRFVPATVRPLPGTMSAFEIRPFGERLRRLKATPSDQIPDPPCGAMGWSTHGVRYFITDTLRPDLMIYVNEGQDGTQIDPASIRWDREPGRYGRSAEIP